MKAKEIQCSWCPNDLTEAEIVSCYDPEAKRSFNWCKECYEHEVPDMEGWEDQDRYLDCYEYDVELTIRFTGCGTYIEHGGTIQDVIESAEEYWKEDWQWHTMPAPSNIKVINPRYTGIEL